MISIIELFETGSYSEEKHFKIRKLADLFMGRFIHIFTNKLIYNDKDSQLLTLLVNKYTQSGLKDHQFR